MKRHHELSISGIVAKPGQAVSGVLQIKQDGKSVRLPLLLINGSRPGPKVLVLANQHGNELNGMESARTFFQEINPGKLRGQIILFPSMNPEAAMLGTPTWAEGTEAVGVYESKFNLNHIWPGNANTTLAGKIVHEIWNSAVAGKDRKADLLIDLHCHRNPTAVYAEDDEAGVLGIASGMPVVVMTRGNDAERCGKKQLVTGSNLACARNGIPSITIELKGQDAFFPESIRQGKTALLNLCRYLGMLGGAMVLPENTAIIDPWRAEFVPDTHRQTYSQYRSKYDALFVPHVSIYERVRRNQVVGHILDPYTAQILEECPSPMNGGLYGIAGKGQCKNGEILFTAAHWKAVNPNNVIRKINKKSTGGAK